jgi:hypothetical protein
MATQQVVPVTCPNCQAQFTAPIHSIIDGQDPALKAALLQGRLNLAQCPQCGFTDVLNSPLFYYDQEKELAFVLAPNDLQLMGSDQEKVIGNLTNSLINSLPAEERKFYLFNPKQFLTMDSLVKAVLEAEGITEEMLESQEAKVKLIQEFLALSDETSLKEKIKAREAELDREFFEILTASIQAAQMAGDMTNFQALLGLRTLLARYSSKSRKIIAELDAEMEAIFIQSQGELIEKLQAAKDDKEIEELVAAGYTLLDYTFFQKLTAQIDEAEKGKNTKKASELKVLRSKVVEIKDAHEAVIREALEESAKLLEEIVQSGNPERALAKRLDEIDQTFFMVLSANIEEAQRQKHEDAVKALTIVGNLAMSMIQQREMQRAKSTTADTETSDEPEKPKIEIAR